LWGLTFLLAASRAGLAGEAQSFTPAPPPSDEGIAGSAEVKGHAAELSSRAANMLAMLGASGNLKILEHADDRIVFEGTGQALANGLQGIGWGGFRRGEIWFTERGGKTRIDYAVTIPSQKWLLWTGFAVQALGLIALIVGFWALQTYVVTSPSPAVRTQVVQA